MFLIPLMPNCACIDCESSAFQSGVCIFWAGQIAAQEFTVDIQTMNPLELHGKKSYSISERCYPHAFSNQDVLNTLLSYYSHAAKLMLYPVRDPIIVTPFDGGQMKWMRPKLLYYKSQNMPAWRPILLFCPLYIPTSDYMVRKQFRVRFPCALNWTL